VLQDVLSIMKERGYVRIPIIDQDSGPSGVLDVQDALQALLEEVEYDRSFIRDYREIDRIRSWHDFALC
jgi:CBS domain-containing protein